MTEMTAKYIFLFLLMISVLNFVIALMAKRRTQISEFKLLSWYWGSVIFTFLAAAVLSKTENQIAYSFFFQVIPINIISYLLSVILGIRFHTKLICSIQLFAFIISAFCLEMDIGFTKSLIPVCLGYTIPLIGVVWHCLIANRKHTSWLEKGMGFVFFAGAIHNFDFALFRLDPSAAAWGWAISTAQFQCISVFLPLIINHRRDMKERKNLQTALEKISGKTHYDQTKLDDLHHELQLQIQQKEAIRNLLSATNQSLEEEREINEILIKTISHDLANPLTAINAYIELLHSNRIPKSQQDLVWKRLTLSTTSAMDMISRIRTAILTKSQADLVAVSDVSVDKAIKKLISDFETQLQKKNITIIYNDSINFREFVLAEENTLIEHVFANILSNAIKFSYEASEIHIEVSDDNDYLKVDFRDFGVGIQEMRLDRKLLHSTQGTLGETGTGFGMMVMGYFLKKFGGHAEIKSQSEGPDRGTMVSIYLKKSESITANIQQNLETANIYS